MEVAWYGVMCGVRLVRSWDADMGSGVVTTYYITGLLPGALLCSFLHNAGTNRGFREANNTVVDLNTGKSSLG